MTCMKSVCMYVSIFVCMWISSFSLKKINYDLFWSYTLITVLPLPVSIDFFPSPSEMYNLVSGWILWYICFSQMPCGLIKSCLKTKQKIENCTLVCIPPPVVAQREEKTCFLVSQVVQCFDSRSSEEVDTLTWAEASAAC